MFHFVVLDSPRRSYHARRRMLESVYGDTLRSMSAPMPIVQSDRKSYQYFLAGLILALLIWGLQLIGVTVNVWLGGLVLAIALGLMVYAFWIW